MAPIIVPNHHQHDDVVPGRRPRLIMLAYACVPGGGSEPGVGWNRAVQAGRFVDTWVICEGRECEAAVTEYIDEHGRVPGVTFHFLPLSRLEMTLRSIPGGYYLAYNLWHRRAFALAKNLHRQHGFDLAHQVNIVSFREPGYLWRLSIPFIWGPVGGTQNCPSKFLGTLRRRDAVKEIIRSCLNKLQLRFGWRQRRAARRAAVVIAANSTIARDLTRVWRILPQQMSEVGLNYVVDRPKHERSSERELNILWAGHVNPCKALPLLIIALGKLPPDLRWKVRVLGDGPILKSCKQTASRLGIGHRIEWLGWRPRQEVLQQYVWADVFAFTSLRDTTGTVVLEAISNGVPVICLDHQGVGDVITPECGIRIPVTNPDRVTNEIAAAFELLAASPEKRQSLQLGALKRAEHFHWPQLGNRMAETYRKVLAAAGSNAVPHERQRQRIGQIEPTEVAV